MPVTVQGVFLNIIFNPQNKPIIWAMAGHTGLCLRTPKFRECKHLM